MTSKLKPCPSCEKEVAKSAKVCPHCGKKLSMGCLLKTILLLVAIIVVGFIMIITLVPSEEDREDKLAHTLATIASAPVANISPRGELAEIFNPNSEHTDLQRDDKEKELQGQVVQWSLPVYEVSRTRDGYRIQTDSDFALFGGPALVGTLLTVHARNDAEVAFIEGLKTGDEITIKGRIKGVSLRHIEIDPAMVVMANGLSGMREDSAEIGNDSNAANVFESADATEADEPGQDQICASMYRNLTPSDMTPVAIAEFKQECPGFDLPIQWEEVASAATAEQSDVLPASFDCTKASTSVEKIICGDPQISHLDGQLANLYSAALRTGASPDAVRASQREWMKRRNACADSSCVKGAYEERIIDPALVVMANDSTGMREDSRAIGNNSNVTAVVEDDHLEGGENCEEGATNMAEVYECVYLKIEAELEMAEQELRAVLNRRSFKQQLTALQLTQQEWRATRDQDCQEAYEAAFESVGGYAQGEKLECIRTWNEGQIELLQAYREFCEMRDASGCVIE